MDQVNFVPALFHKFKYYLHSSKIPFSSDMQIYPNLNKKTFVAFDSLI